MNLREHWISLEDLLQEPIIQLVMKRDGVTADDIRMIFACLRRLGRLP